MKAVKRYQWFEERDGILRVPDPVGPYYDACSLSTYDTEEEAISAYVEMKQLHKFGVPYELVLLPVFRLEKEND